MGERRPSTLEYFESVSETAERTGQSSITIGTDRAAEAAALIRELVGALESNRCPYAFPEDDGTVRDCVSKGHCGCDNGTALSHARATGGEDV